ncbi:MAG: hypothetical protein R3Y24_15255 [Eubacteriales bacterium]
METNDFRELMGSIEMVKYVAVFVTVVLGYIIIFPVYKKVSYAISYKRKRDIAVSRNHIIKAKRIKSSVRGSVNEYRSYGTYIYTMNGKEKKFKAMFKNSSMAPAMIDLMYVKNPKKVFCYEEYHWENYKAIILLPIMAFPWVLGMIAVWLLQLQV